MVKPVRTATTWVLGLLGLMLFALPAGAQPHYPINLSLYYPVSLNSDPNATSNVRLALIHGRQGSVRGLDITGIAGVLHDEMRGLQITGVYSHVGGQFRGVAFTGFANYFTGDGRGAIFAPVNVVTAEFGGIQLGALVNYQLEGFSGAQFSGSFNLVEGTVKGLQAASFANASTGDVRGLQVAAGLNVAAGASKAVQIGAVNMGYDFHGAQVGIFNSATLSSGLQVGALNWVGTHSGMPIGFINIARNGEVNWVTYLTNVSLINTGLRTVVNNWAAEFSVGYNDVQADYLKTWFINWHFGRRIPVSERFDLTGDLGFVHIIPEATSDPAVNDRLQFALQARVLAELRFSARFALYGGVGASLRYSEYGSGAQSEWDPVGVFGISLF